MQLCPAGRAEEPPVRGTSDGTVMLVYLASLTHESGRAQQNRCLPLAVGYIGGYLAKTLAPDVEVEIFKRPSALVEAIIRRPPDVLMLSNYMWNVELSCAVAKAARQRLPALLTVMGGPNFSLDRALNVEFLRRNPAIDVLVQGDGEIPAVALVREFLRTRDRRAVKALAFPTTLAVEGDEVFCGEAGAVETRLGLGDSELDEIPSPYLSGLFDGFFEDGAIPLVETNRGCPFRCAFCQQGDSYFSRVRDFSIERVAAEFEYIGRRIQELGVNMPTVEIADPNFAMYKRDSQVIDAIRAVQDRYNYPQIIGCSTGKNRADLIIENTAKLKPGSIQLRSAMQSLHPETLKAVNRDNIRLETYYGIQKEMDRRSLENNADLMLCLPNETRDSHIAGIYKLVDLGIREFSCLQTIILKGTEMETPDYRRRYGLRTKERVIPECYGRYDLFGDEQLIFETEEIIIETGTLSHDDYLSCRKMHLLVMILHNTRLLIPVYRYLDSLGVPRSSVLRHCFEDGNSPLSGVIAGFLEDTRNEVFHREDLVGREDDFEALTHNKIFKHLAIALHGNKDAVREAVRSALLHVLGPDAAPEAQELAELIEACIVSPTGALSEQTWSVRSPALREVFGPSLQLSYSESQRNLLALLGSIYQNEDDRISKLAYHLRPANMSLKINTTLWNGQLSTA